MSRKRDEEVEVVEEVEEVEEEPKKGRKDKESVEKRKKAKKVDAISRWSGVIFLGLILLIGLLLWVGGEMSHEDVGMQKPITNYPSAQELSTMRSSAKPSQSAKTKVIVE